MSNKTCSEKSHCDMECPIGYKQNCWRMWLYHKLDMLTITEAWCKGDERDHFFFADITNTLPDFQIHQLPRTGKSW